MYTVSPTCVIQLFIKLTACKTKVCKLIALERRKLHVLLLVKHSKTFEILCSFNQYD